VTRTILNRLILVALAALIPCAVLVAWAALTLRPGLPAAAQSALEQYRQYRSARNGESLTVQTIVEAWHPSEFTPRMSGDTYGDGRYFRAQHVYADMEGGHTPLTVPAPGSVSSSRPLPYPPTDAWCVVLGVTGTQSSRVVVIAMHEDAYVAAWVVHELANGPQAPEFAADMAQLGCATPGQGGSHAYPPTR